MLGAKAASVVHAPNDATVEAGASVTFYVIPAWGAPVPGEVYITWNGGPEPVAIAMPPG